jgi:hypothetical protein
MRQQRLNEHAPRLRRVPSHARSEGNLCTLTAGVENGRNGPKSGLGAGHFPQ